MAKKDIWIIGGVLAAALLLFFVTRFAGKTPEATVTVYVHDQVYAKVSADAYQTITVDQGDGKVNVIVIDAKGVRMDSSTCKNQICVQTGVLDPRNADELLLNNWIVCLPNAVTVELTAAAEAEG